MLVLLIGNVGTGKSTFCSRLKKNDRLIICPDNYVGDDKEKQKRLFLEIENGLENYKHVIIDSPAINKSIREKLLYFKKNKYQAICFDFGSGNRKTVERRIKNKPKTSSYEWAKIHLKNIRDYEKPELNEGFVRIITVKGVY